jgi:aspartyl-tRNA(Asn)/glutamyl-tRNA(Gln) amidotransferase subunit B
MNNSAGLLPGIFITVILSVALEHSYEAVIGLEVHAQLLTKSKLFCGDSTAFGAEPNSQVSAISLAHPGTLPVMNASAIALAVRLGLALGCDIIRDNYFARKNYFYPDLPKGYQVSQHTAPICMGGAVMIGKPGEKTPVSLNRIHMEEDAGKSLHDLDDAYTMIDLNRAGMPLLEIVTEPVIHSSEDAYQFLTELRRLVRWLGVCDGNMEEGSMRCDANISIRPSGSSILGTRVEVKNLNSIRNVKKAIDIEIARLTSMAQQDIPIRQETRSFNADEQTTFTLRTKESEDDYRYFPEPDLPPFHITDAYLDEIKAEMPEIPSQLEERFSREYGLSAYDAAQLCQDKDAADLFIHLVSIQVAPKPAANWIIGPLTQYASAHHIPLQAGYFPVQGIAELIRLTEENRIGFQAASTRILPVLMESLQHDPLTIAREMNLLQESNQDALLQWVQETIRSMPEKVAAYRSGKKGLIGLFAGDVKKRSKGQADMQQVTALLEQELNNHI